MDIRNAMLFPLRLFFDKIALAYKKRLAKIIVSLCEKDSYILDFGCDDGFTANMIMKFNPSLKIVGVDIQSNRPSMIPKQIYTGERIPYFDNFFDIVISLDVLHHTKNILNHIKELKRVSRKYIIIKDHMAYSAFSKLLICFTDFIGNVPYGINCTFNFPTFKEWRKMFNEMTAPRPKGWRCGARSPTGDSGFPAKLR